jgi:hypothetical protein
MSGEDLSRDAAERRDVAAFWVEAMLPGFFVLDAELGVVDRNELATDLLTAAKLVPEASELATTTYSFRPLADVPAGRRGKTVSITDGLIHRDHHPQMAELVRLFDLHREMVDTFNAEGAPRPPIEVADRFRTVAVGVPDVQVYAYAPQWQAVSDDASGGRRRTFRAGVRLSPAAGIRLTIESRAATLNVVPLPNIVDIVCAWRILCEWDADGKRIARLVFCGAQPAFHDATERNRLWQIAQKQLQVEAEANLTRLWSHALGTDVRTLNSARDSARELYIERDIELAEDAYLWLEKAFSELDSHVGFLRIVRSLSASRIARAAERANGREFAPLASLIAASFASALRTLVADREFERRLHPALRPAVIRVRAGGLDTLLRMSRLPDRHDEQQLRELLAATGVQIATWHLDDAATILVPTESTEHDDEAVTSRALRLLFEEYSYNALKALLKQEAPRLWLEVRRAADASIVQFFIANSCQSDPGSHGTWHHEDEKGTQDNQKGLFTNYRVFWELFGGAVSGYRRAVTADRFSIELQFPPDAFVVGERNQS